MGRWSLAQALALGKAVWPVFLSQSPATLWPRRYDGLLWSGVRAPVDAHGLFVLFSFSSSCLPNHLPFFFFSPSPPLSFSHLLPKSPPSKLAKPADTCFFLVQCFSSKGLLPASYHGYHGSSQLAEPSAAQSRSVFLDIDTWQHHSDGMGSRLRTSIGIQKSFTNKIKGSCLPKSY